MKLKRNLLFYIISAVSFGVLIGGIIWGFLISINICFTLLWETVPSDFNFMFYPVIICGIGGIIVGFSQKLIGNYPETFENVLETIKKTRRYAPCKLIYIMASAFLPIILGGSIGPEAGIAGVTAWLCTWMKDKFVTAAKKKLLYSIAAISGIAFVFCLNMFVKSSLHIARFNAQTLHMDELLWFIPLIVLGILAGYFYYAFDKIIAFISRPMKKYPVILAVIGGFLLGISGVFFPFTMFSGEFQMTELMQTQNEISPTILFCIGFIKLIIISVCIHSGWRGGNIFPIIFSGLCIGLGFYHITGANMIFSTAVITAVICGFVIKKPIAVILILFLFFPINISSIIYISIASIIGSKTPILKEKIKNVKKTI